ncbi:phosphoribosyltransferase [Prosthecobacter sp.]|uniref:phosphoribosyltransferase n=1 Tax=Prosthecobacter sp. TaxID=1965333 RepID=UPI003784ED4A
MKPIFQNRREAGQRLAERLVQHAGSAGLIVLGLPRGGVPVAFEVASRLGAPLDVMIVRKLGVPGFEEVAMGALASGGLRVLNPEVLRRIPEAASVVEEVTTRESAELERREQAYRGGREAPDLNDRVVILVDDGLATGATMRAAVRALRERTAVRKIVVAVPVGSEETCGEMAREADECVCLLMPRNFRSVGEHYEDFSQTTDEEVRRCLADAST